MTKELGHFKSLINPILYSSEEIRQVLLGSDYRDQYDSETAVAKELKKHIKSHLYIDETITDMTTYIMYDVFATDYKGAMKSLVLNVYVFCHKDIIDTCTLTGREGNRIDMLCELVEEEILSPEHIRQFGVGKLKLSNIGHFGNQKYFVGKTLTFTVPNFNLV